MNKSTHSTPRSKDRGLLRVDTERRVLLRTKVRSLAPSNVSSKHTKGAKAKPVSKGISGGREFTGTVLSKPVGMTVKVLVTRLFRHPFYGKILRRTKKFLCHVEGLDIEVGDAVRIRETRPISKNKHFVVVGKTNK